jgi:hypothetical protein
MHSDRKCGFLLWSSFLIAAFSGWPCVSTAQTYDDVERRVRQQLEAEQAAALGDCSNAMLSWLAMRFSETDRRLGKPARACDDARLFALRNNVPFTVALPRVAAAYGGTRSEACPPHASNNAVYILYSNCHHPVATQPTVPSAWELDRQREVAEFGSEALRHIRLCLNRAEASFAFTVGSDGRINGFSDRGDWGRTAPPRDVQLELTRIERALRSDTRCNVFPERLRHRYISVSATRSALVIDQVRDESAHR